MFPHAAKGVMVISSRLQSGAEMVAKSGKLGIIKFDENGLDIIADRRGSIVESSFVKSQILPSEFKAKSLKFSAYDDDVFFSSLEGFLKSLDPELVSEPRAYAALFVPFIAVETIKNAAWKLLKRAGYQSGPVDLQKICSTLSIDLKYSTNTLYDVDGSQILGSANFSRNLITVNSNGNSNRERFTLAHEIGHFYLEHKKYLASETIIENDFHINRDDEKSFNYERLEYQANIFSSNLLLPDDVFKSKTAEYRRELDIQDRGHGYIFVDGQTCNYLPYDRLLSDLSAYFEVSKRAIEVKLKSLGMLTDQRQFGNMKPFAKTVAKLGLFQNL